MTTNYKTIAGVSFKAIRVMEPRPHWKVQVIQTGFVFSGGVFDGSTKAKLWESIRHTAMLLGADRFARQTLQASYACGL